MTGIPPGLARRATMANMDPAEDPAPEADKHRRWRRTSFRRLDGRVEFSPDDWTLADPAGQPLARIYRTTGGPQAGRWAWFVLVDAHGRPFNGGTGTAEEGTRFAFRQARPRRSRRQNDRQVCQ